MRIICLVPCGQAFIYVYVARSSTYARSCATTLVAAMFMFTSITLAYKSSLRNQSGSDIEEDIRRLQSEQSPASKEDAVDEDLPIEVEDPGPPPSPEPVPETSDPTTEPGSLLEAEPPPMGATEDASTEP